MCNRIDYILEILEYLGTYNNAPPVVVGISATKEWKDDFFEALAKHFNRPKVENPTDQGRISLNGRPISVSFSATAMGRDFVAALMIESFNGAVITLDTSDEKFELWS